MQQESFIIWFGDRIFVDESVIQSFTSHLMLLIDMTQSYLNSGFTQSCPLGQLLPHEGIRVVSSLEYLKQRSNEYSAFLFKQSNIFQDKTIQDLQMSNVKYSEIS